VGLRGSRVPLSRPEIEAAEADEAAHKHAANASATPQARPERTLPSIDLAVLMCQVGHRSIRQVADALMLDVAHAFFNVAHAF